MAGYRTAFPETVVTINDLVAEGDTVVARWIGDSGPQEGELRMPGAQFAPTGKGYTITGVSILGIRDGKIAEHWADWGALGLFQQLGVVPAPGDGKGTSGQVEAASGW